MKSSKLPIFLLVLVVSGCGGGGGAVFVPPALVAIAVTPANPSIALGTTQQFTATGTYGNSSSQNITAAVTWRSSNSAVATISTNGLATPIAVGTTRIKA
ncbi:MAG TPA: Ig-like domain-containing protein, partial [Geobacteraceae bacterium]|nr:Ig-like domain-containing protein [Geobacteraceae bacterium]